MENIEKQFDSLVRKIPENGLEGRNGFSGTRVDRMDLCLLEKVPDLRFSES